jgi:DNA end-binding protein Ku
MRYADEVLEPGSEVELPEGTAAPSTRELDMARQLVNTLAGHFDPEKYRDEYREEVLALIDRKAAGEEVVASPTQEEPAKVLDLMAALEASLARTGARQRGKGDANDAGDAEDVAPPKPRTAGTAKRAAAAKKATPARKSPARQDSVRKEPAKRSRKSA